MQEIQTLLLGNERLDFKIDRGVVVGDKKWSDTHIYSSGGGGYVGPNGGYVSPPSVNSKIQQRHEAWFRMDGDNREISMDLSGHNIPLREGNKVAFIQACASDDTELFFLINKTTQKIHRLSFKNRNKFGERAAKLNDKLCGFWSFISLFLGVALGFAAMAAYPSVDVLARRTKGQMDGVVEVATATQISTEVLTSRDYDVSMRKVNKARVDYQVNNFGIAPNEISPTGTFLRKEGENKILRIIKKKFGIPLNNRDFETLSEIQRTRARHGDKATEIFFFLNGYSLTAHENFISYLNLIYDARKRDRAVGVAVGIIVSIFGWILVSPKCSHHSRVASEVNNKFETFLAELEQKILLEQDVQR